MGFVIQSVRPNHFSKELLKFIFMKLDFIKIYDEKHKGLNQVLKD